MFKFADRTALYFQCQIAITIRDPQSACPRPSCTSLRTPTNRIIEAESNHSHEGTYHTTPSPVQRVTLTTITHRHQSRIRYRRAESVPSGDQDVNVWDVRAPVINAFDVDVDGVLALKTNPALRELEVANRTITIGEQYCLQAGSLALLILAVIGSILAIGIALFIFCMRRRRRGDAMQKLY